MKYKDKYPELEPLEETNFVMRSRTSCPCAVCGEQTSFIDIGAETYFCSEECCDAWYHEYWNMTGGPCQAEDFIEGEE